jgi:beta-lactam-binding protein with PASTA domain
MRLPGRRGRRREIVDEDVPTQVIHERTVELGPPDPLPGPGPPGVVEEVGARVVSEDERIDVGPGGAVTRQYDRVEQEVVRRRRGFNEIGWALLVLLILVAVGIGAWWYFAHRGEAKRTVPAVTGMPVATAVNTLQARGLRAQITSQVHPEAAGTVYGEIPAAGNRVKKGSTVQLLASKGPATVVVPNAVGLTDTTARDRLVGAGFKVTEMRVFNQEKPGTVVAQSPAAGSKAGSGTTVQINISKGTGVVIVPNVVGVTVGDAETLLAKAGLKGVVQLRVPSSQPTGTVVAQNPPGGQARRGSTVRLNVSTGSGAGASGATGVTGPTGPSGTP